jgi:hypothetical protein
VQPHRPCRLETMVSRSTPNPRSVSQKVRQRLVSSAETTFTASTIPRSTGVPPVVLGVPPETSGVPSVRRDAEHNRRDARAPRNEFVSFSWGFL